MRQQADSLTGPERKDLIHDEEKWLAPALLEAAERDELLEVAQLLDRRRSIGPILNSSHHRLIAAYSVLLALRERPPFIGELLEQLEIKKPPRTRDNSDEWFRIDRRERVIRKTLKRYNLPLSAGKRGRY